MPLPSETDPNLLDGSIEILEVEESPESVFATPPSVKSSKMTSEEMDTNKTTLENLLTQDVPTEESLEWDPLHACVEFATEDFSIKTLSLDEIPEHVLLQFPQSSHH